jgi:cyclophilin family peptidyl-prolyl cis-trans isomerase
MKSSYLLVVALAALPAGLAAQQAALTDADSALVGRILLAEDRRDSTDRALADGAAHPDARVSTLAKRARWRITDSLFGARDSLPPLPLPRVWADPAWRLRFRAIATRRDDCAALGVALADSAWPVRLRAADLAMPTCATDEAIVATLADWVDGLPRRATRRERGGVSWHAAAHALVALARLRPDDARPRVGRLARHRQWQVRVYAARAAAALSDTATLRRLARDRDDNVKEAAIGALSTLTGHDDDELFLAALRSDGAQAVRAAAIALKGSPHRDLRARADAAFARWVARDHASARDARLALLDAAGRPPADDRPPASRAVLPPDAVALALGEAILLRVEMAATSGGGAFVVRLRGDAAPMMAARVLALARDGYYDETGWHRVEHDFVIQGGGPGANEYVGHAAFFRDELATIPHARGTVGMSTRGHDTGDAQWFINLRNNLRLGRDYSVFAEVVEGIDVVDGILEGDVIASMRPVP